MASSEAKSVGGSSSSASEAGGFDAETEVCVLLLLLQLVSLLLAWCGNSTAWGLQSSCV